MQRKSDIACREELKELFRFDRETNCNTADLLSDFPNEASVTLDGPLLRIFETGIASFLYRCPNKAHEEMDHTTG